MIFINKKRYIKITCMEKNAIDFIIVDLLQSVTWTVLVFDIK